MSEHEVKKEQLLSVSQIQELEGKKRKSNVQNLK